MNDTNLGSISHKGTKTQRHKGRGRKFTTEDWLAALAYEFHGGFM